MRFADTHPAPVSGGHFTSSSPGPAARRGSGCFHPIPPQPQPARAQPAAAAAALTLSALLLLGPARGLLLQRPAALLECSLAVVSCGAVAGTDPELAARMKRWRGGRGAPWKRAGSMLSVGGARTHASTLRCTSACASAAMRSSACKVVTSSRQTPPRALPPTQNHPDARLCRALAGLGVC
eukprot:3185124-Rhodomonas_salina.4